MIRHIRLATRSSELALWQARFVAGLLRKRWPGLTTELVPVTSTGDRDTETPLYGMGNIGVFSKEVHLAVLEGQADCAVHSCKDLPTTVPEGIRAPFLLERHDERDALIGASSVAALKPGATVGSSSLRRRSQLAALRPDLQFVDIRGNVDTRLQKVGQGQADATILAMAGLLRLGKSRTAKAVPLHPQTEMIPAVAQGAIAVDCRDGDTFTAQMIQALHHPVTATAVQIERRVLAGLRGGCSLPLGCHVSRHQHSWQLHACLDTKAGMRHITLAGPAADLAERCLQALQA